MFRSCHHNIYKIYTTMSVIKDSINSYETDVWKLERVRTNWNCENKHCADICSEYGQLQEFLSTLHPVTKHPINIYWTVMQMNVLNWCNKLTMMIPLCCLHRMCYCCILYNSDIFTDIDLHFNTEKAQWRPTQKSVSHQMNVARYFLFSFCFSLMGTSFV